MKSRQVIADIKKTIDLLNIETDPQTFRLIFVSALTLSRSVGHVLHKVDSKSDLKTKKAIETWWSDLKKNRSKNSIFFDFIENERNSVIKEYEFNHDDSDQILYVPNYGLHFTMSELLFCPINGGPFEGEDCRDVLSEAVQWWETQLDKIEKEAQPVIP